MSNKVLITNDQNVVKVPSGLRILIRRSCNAVLDFEHFDGPAEISVTFVDNNRIHELNKEYRDKDSATDVLSFPLGENGEYDIDEDNGCKLLGDIVISMERAMEQAELYGHSLQREVAYLTVHSMLHLLGYDHEAGGLEAVRMREANVVTAEDAEAFFAHSKKVQDGARTVLRRLGKRRQPSQDELDLYRKWTQEWRYEPEAILEACAETTKGEPTFAYLDGILNGIRARAEQEDMTAWAVHDRLTVRGTPGQLLSVLQMTEELQLSLSGLFYPLDHCDVEFGHPLGVSNVLTEPEAQIAVHKGWALVLHFHPPA